MSFTLNNVACNTLSDLIGLPAGFFTNAAKAFLGGASSTRDGEGGIYEFDPSSTATADQYYIVRQTAIAEENPGRWFRLTEFDPVTNIVPTGALNMWGSATPPSGWLLCDGSAISRTTYSTLFAIIGTTYGMGDGSTTFNIPDMRQRFPLGLASSGTGSTLGNSGGTIDHAHGSPITSGQPSALTANIGLLGLANAGSDTHTHQVTLTAQNPPFVVVNFIIKT